MCDDDDHNDDHDDGNDFFYDVGFLCRYNMYGAPVFKQESALGNVKKGANAVAKRAKQGIIDEAIPIICLLISSISMPSSSSQPPSSSSTSSLPSIPNVVCIGILGEIDWQKYYNDVPEKGTQYKG